MVSKVVFAIALIFSAVVILWVVLSLTRMLYLLLTRYKSEEIERSFGKNWTNTMTLLFRTLVALIPAVVLWLIYFKFLQ